MLMPETRNESATADEKETERRDFCCPCCLPAHWCVFKTRLDFFSGVGELDPKTVE
jgi:hypothetical protein